eukprot:870107-Pelagomonas_calceolata.AAC.2
MSLHSKVPNAEFEECKVVSASLTSSPVVKACTCPGSSHSEEGANGEKRPKTHVARLPCTGKQKMGSSSRCKVAAVNPQHTQWICTGI